MSVHERIAEALTVGAIAGIFALGWTVLYAFG